MELDGMEWMECNVPEWTGLEWSWICNGMEIEMEWDGMEWNGMELFLEWNGIEWNKMESNELTRVGMEWYGMRGEERMHGGGYI